MRHLHVFQYLRGVFDLLVWKRWISNLWISEDMKLSTLHTTIVTIVIRYFDISFIINFSLGMEIQSKWNSTCGADPRIALVGYITFLQHHGIVIAHFMFLMALANLANLSCKACDNTALFSNGRW